MATDHLDSSRPKHRRSSGNELEEPSKRRKHRQHRQSSRKQREELEAKRKDEETKANANWRPDYDMEEGEIVEDEDLGVHKASAELSSSLPSIDENSVEEVGKVVRCSSILLGEDSGSVTNTTVDGKEIIGDGSMIDDGTALQRNSSTKFLANGDIVHKSSKEDNSQLRGSSSHLPSHDKHREKVSSRNRSRSHDRVRERYRSQSIFQEDSCVQIHQRGVVYSVDRKHKRDSDDDIMSRHRKRDKERERSSSYSRHTEQADRHHSRETRDSGREGSRETWDRDWEMKQDTRGERDRERESDWETNKQREREMERVRERDRYREREMEREREGERRRERERDRNRDRGSGRVSRHQKYYDGDDGRGHRDWRNDNKHRRLDETDHRDRSRKNDQDKLQSSRNDHSQGDNEKTRRDKVEQEDYQERIVLQLAEQEEEDFKRIKEESIRRRLAILDKYKTKPLQQQPRLGDIVKEDEIQPFPHVAAANIIPETIHDQNDDQEIYIAETSFSVGKSPPLNGLSAFEKSSGTGGLGEGTPKSERSDDMFRDDIFGDSPAGVRKLEKGDGLAIERSGLHDNWDDAEGYYSYRFGEILDGRYEVVAAHGKGVFSTVVRAKDLRAGSGDPEEVAIKIIRNNDTMYKAGLEELVILKKLVGADPEDKRHCVRFLSSFKYRNHLCLVFESLHMNLREVLKKFGRNIGLKLSAVRAYAKQLFIALKHLRNCGILHSDIKPDNMLVNDAKNVLKLCDFGNAMFAGKNEITPYLVSRFYRAPEIILGLPYDHPMDIWSVGCCLFELYIGKVLFPGSTNNDMLRLHMELKGPFPKKMLRKGAFTGHHFDQDLNFLVTEEDPVTKKIMKRLLFNFKPKDFSTIVLSSPGEDPKMLVNFKDILEKIFVLDPDKRITVSQALSHPFITGK
ncbi:hypothetical protein LguiA_000550 [Lonicera macranthoides]